MKNNKHSTSQPKRMKLFRTTICRLSTRDLSGVNGGGERFSDRPTCTEIILFDIVD